MVSLLFLWPPHIFFVQWGRQMKAVLWFKCSPWSTDLEVYEECLHINKKKILLLHYLNRLVKDFILHLCWFNLSLSERGVPVRCCPTHIWIYHVRGPLTLKPSLPLSLFFYLFWVDHDLWRNLVGKLLFKSYFWTTNTFPQFICYFMSLPMTANILELFHLTSITISIFLLKYFALA